MSTDKGVGLASAIWSAPVRRHLLSCRETIRGYLGGTVVNSQARPSPSLSSQCTSRPTTARQCSKHACATAGEAKSSQSKSSRSWPLAVPQLARGLQSTWERNTTPPHSSRPARLRDRCKSSAARANRSSCRPSRGQPANWRETREAPAQGQGRAGLERAGPKEPERAPQHRGS